MRLFGVTYRWIICLTSTQELFSVLVKYGLEAEGIGCGLALLLVKCLAWLRTHLGNVVILVSVIAVTIGTSSPHAVGVRIVFVDVCFILINSHLKLFLLQWVFASTTFVVTWHGSHTINYVVPQRPYIIDHFKF